MRESLHLAIAFSVGTALGAFYFLGLWKTLHRVLDASNPAIVMFGSYIIRTSVVLAGFWIVMDGHWQRGVAALAAFVLMRMILARRLGKERAVYKRTI